MPAAQKCLALLDLLRQLTAIAPEVPVVVVTAHAAVDDAVAAMREGAFDYIAKPVNREELKLVLGRALEVKELVHENRRLRQVVSDRLDFDDMIGSSPAMQPVLQIAAQAAQVDSTVLLLGESGTGKELLAKAIHVNGPRKNGPLQPRPRNTRQKRRLSRRPLLPAVGHPHRAPAAPRPPSRPPAPGRTPPREVLAKVSQEAGARSGGVSRPRALRVAGEYP